MDGNSFRFAQGCIRNLKNFNELNFTKNINILIYYDIFNIYLFRFVILNKFI
jgi:hypothetical protein